MKRISVVLSIVSSVVFLSLFIMSCGGGGGGDSSNQSSPNVIFVTSVTGDGNLGGWPDAGVNTGLAAADAICQARASAAGLPGTFVAWLSDSSDDAYCRAHGLSGKKSANCGQGSLPTSAGPWVRTDGFPFGETIDELLNNVVYAPVRFDEFASTLDAGTQYFTATSPSGTFDSDWSSCQEWTDNQHEWVTCGDPETTAIRWTDTGRIFCDSDRSLLCLEPGAGGSLPNFVSEGKKVFLSTVRSYGDHGALTEAGGNTGLAAGDAICRNLANAAGLANTVNFKAWLSDSTTDASARITSDGPWVRLDGVKVADNRADLLDGALFAPINVTDAGEYDLGRGVWTGTIPAGTKSGYTCTDWTTLFAVGTSGGATYANSNWTDGPDPTPGTGNYPIYCFED